MLDSAGVLVALVVVSLLVPALLAYISFRSTRRAPLRPPPAASRKDTNKAASATSDTAAQRKFDKKQEREGRVRQCKFCDVVCDSADFWRTHLEGKRHQKLAGNSSDCLEWVCPPARAPATSGNKGGPQPPGRKTAAPPADEVHGAQVGATRLGVNVAPAAPSSAAGGGGWSKAGPAGGKKRSAGNRGAANQSRPQHGGLEPPPRVSKRFMLEDGHGVNVLQGLELHREVVPPNEQTALVSWCEAQLRRGKAGALVGATYMQGTVPRKLWASGAPPASMQSDKWRRGKGREVLQYGVFYDYGSHRIAPENPVEEMPEELLALAAQLCTAGIGIAAGPPNPGRSHALLSDLRSTSLWRQSRRIGSSTRPSSTSTSQEIASRRTSSTRRRASCAQASRTATLLSCSHVCSQQTSAFASRARRVVRWQPRALPAALLRRLALCRGAHPLWHRLARAQCHCPLRHGRLQGALLAAAARRLRHRLPRQWRHARAALRARRARVPHLHHFPQDPCRRQARARAAGEPTGAPRRGEAPASLRARRVGHVTEGGGRNE